MKNINPLSEIILFSIFLLFGYTGNTSIPPLQSSSTHWQQSTDTNIFKNDSLITPLYLLAQVIDNNVELTWGSDDSQGEWLSYTNSEFNISVGLSDTTTWAIAARWTSEQLLPYQNLPITRITFFPTGEQTNYNVKIWEGNGAQNIVYQKPITNPVVGEWNEIQLSDPVMIAPGKEYWIGIEMQQDNTEDFGASLDTGPAVEGFGDMLLYNEEWFSNSATFGFEGNWMIGAYVLTLQNELKLLASDIHSSSALAKKTDLQKPADFPNTSPPFPFSKNKLKAENITGFNVYRNDTLVNISPLTENTYLDQDLQQGVYQYDVTTLYEDGESTPVSRIVQVGGPTLSVNPFEITDSLYYSQEKDLTITLQNSGNSLLEWEINSLPQWIEMSAINGELPPGEETELSATINSQFMLHGNNESNILFQTNNLNNPVVSLPVNISLSSLFVESQNLQFGDVDLGDTTTARVEMINYGETSVEISNIIFSDPAFTTQTESLSIAPYGSATFMVDFLPVEMGEYADTMTLISNDPVAPVMNFPISAVIDLPSPDFLSASILNENDIQLSWGLQNENGGWLGYGSGEFFGAVGISEPGIFRIAARFPASSLEEYINKPVTRMAFVAPGEFSVYTLKIWRGENAEELMHEQPLHNTGEPQWSEIALSNPVLIDANETYWFGLEIDQLVDYDWSAALDEGPAVTGLGDMVNLGGEWFSLSEQGIDHNWTLRAFVEQTDTTLKEIALPKTERPLPAPVSGLEKEKLVLQENTRSNKNLERLGFHLYRNGNRLNEELITENEFLDENLDAGIYTYGVTSVFEEGESIPTETTVQIGGPEMNLSQHLISDTVQAGDPAIYNVQITNTGLAQLTWQIADLSGFDLPEWLTLSTYEGYLDPTESETLEVTMNTSGLTSNNYTHIVYFETNNLNQPLYKLTLNITVEGEASLVLDTYELDFGMVPVMQSKTMIVTTTNNGNVPVYYNSLETNSYHYQVNVYDWMVPPGESGQIRVTFTPEAPGMIQDSLTIQYFNNSTEQLLTVPLQGTGAAAGPNNLAYSLGENDSLSLTWFPPGFNPDELKFGNGDLLTPLGVSDGVYEFAVRFAPEDLMPYTDKILERIGFYIESTNAEFRLIIRKGENGEEQVLNTMLNSNDLIPFSWNDITLDETLEIDTEDYLWLGYEIDVNGLEFIPGIDSGPVITGSGDFIKINDGGWSTLGEYGFSNNWLIRGVLTDLENETNASNPFNDSVEITAPSDKSLAFLLGYNVYRNGVQINDSLLTQTTFSEVLPEGDQFTYGVSALFEYGESEPVNLEVIRPVPMNAPLDWEFTPTNMAHSIHIPEQLNQVGMSLSEGDLIGAFYDDNGVQRSAGVAVWEEEHLVMTIYGDDPNTPEKDGFHYNEEIHWKVYMPGTDQTARVIAIYDHDMPHYQGEFKMMGLSMVQSLQLDELLSNEHNLLSEPVSVFPNPSYGEIFINNLDGNERIRIFDNSGRLITEQEVNNPLSRLFIDNRGLYVIEIIKSDRVVTRKVIIK